MRTKVALVFGGESPEHGISCLTAASVLSAIDQERFEVLGIGITPSGRWTQVPLEVIRDYRIVDGQTPSVSEDAPDAVWMRTATGCQVATRVDEGLSQVRDVDVAFALLHGPFGEDGTIQGLFEMMGIRYVGCGVAASALGMDKHYMKVAFEAAGLKGCRFVVVDDLRWRHDRDAALAEVAELGFPLFVKPARGGSSIGIRRVADFDELIEAITFARTFDPKVIVEEAIVGREVECAVLGAPDEPTGCLTSLVGEIRVQGEGFYDYEAKYLTEDGAELDVPAVLDPELAAKVQDVAARAFAALGAEGLARVDTFVTPEGEIYLNELNSMPGFTKISMYPLLWQASGMSYSDLVARLIELALARPVGLR